MGRELKRVPLDFDWPLNTIWEGYINPTPAYDCHFCGGEGYSPEARILKARWYSFDEAEWVYLDSGRRWNRLAWVNNLDEDDIAALLDADRLWDFTRVPINEQQRQEVEEKIASGGNSWLPYNNGYVPTPEEVNQWNREDIGHDSINCAIVIEAKAKHMGVPLECSYCKGKGYWCISENAEKRHDNWEPYEPPIGEGYQLWSTTNEGEPSSPVFETLERLSEWCEENATTFGSYRASAFQWYHMLSENQVYHQEGNNIFI